MWFLFILWLTTMLVLTSGWTYTNWQWWFICVPAILFFIYLSNPTLIRHRLLADEEDQEGLDKDEKVRE